VHQRRDGDDETPLQRPAQAQERAPRLQRRRDGGAWELLRVQSLELSSRAPTAL
jgi:hypothetical protein